MITPIVFVLALIVLLVIVAYLGWRQARQDRNIMSLRMSAATIRWYERQRAIDDARPLIREVADKMAVAMGMHPDYAERVIISAMNYLSETETE